MAGYTSYVDYVIFFQDQAEYDFAVNVASGNRLLLDPFHAAELFGIPWPPPSGDMNTIPKGMYIVGPGQLEEPGTYILAANGTYQLNSVPPGVILSSLAPTRQVPGFQGNPPAVWPEGPTVTFAWAASIIKSNAGANPQLQATPIPQRRFIGGTEIPVEGEAGTQSQPNNVCRDASRTNDGFGMAIRGENTKVQLRKTVASVTRPGLTPHTSWERFYFRWKQVGTSAQVVWQCFGATSPASGFLIYLDTDHSIKAQNVNTIGIGTNVGTVFTPLFNTWYLIDILLKFDSGIGTDGRIAIYINHILTFQYTNASSVGLNENSSHLASALGRNNAVVDNFIEYDVDDWMNADLPANFDPLTLALNDPTNPNYSIDFLVGSHMRIQYVTAATMGSYTGTKGNLNQGIGPNVILGPSMQTSASGSIVNGLTDINVIGTQDAVAAVLGPVAVLISEESLNAGFTDGKMGYSVAGGANILTTVDQNNSLRYESVGYFPSGMILPQEISPFRILHQKSTDANAEDLRYLQCIVEYIGIWNNEDDPTMSFQIQTPKFLHNSRYANTMWGNYGPTPSSPVYAVGGTYVGNSTYQEISLPAPCHFLWIRPTAGGSFGIRLQGAGLASNVGSTKQVNPNLRLWTDPITGFTQFAVWGTSVEINLAATTYQYIAFCDPGMRFNYCTALMISNSNLPRVNVLLDSAFTPLAVFTQMEITNTPTSAAGLAYKGAGITGTNGAALSGGLFTNCVDIATGIYSVGSDLITNDQINISLWRSVEQFCSGVMCQICSYVGDGTASQIIPLTPASGRYPLFVLVIPATGGPGQFKDPSHGVGNASSSTANLALSSTAILGVGIDQITAGPDMNVLGTTYSVFVIPGDNLGFNNGIFYNSNCEAPPGSRDIPKPPIGLNLLGEGGLILGGVPISTLLRDISGLYTLIKNKRNDTLIDRQAGQNEVNLAIPNPRYKTGYIGG